MKGPKRPGVEYLAVATDEGATGLVTDGMRAQEADKLASPKASKPSTASPKISTPSPSRQPSARLQARAEAGLMITDMAAIAAGRGMMGPSPPQPTKEAKQPVAKGAEGRSGPNGTRIPAKIEPVIDAAQTQAFVFGTTLARGKRVRGAEGAKAEGAEGPANKRAKTSLGGEGARGQGVEGPKSMVTEGARSQGTLPYPTVGKENRIFHTKPVMLEAGGASAPQPQASSPKKGAEGAKGKVEGKKMEVKGIERGLGGSKAEADQGAEAATALVLDKASAPKMTAEERKKLKLKRQEEVMRAIGSGNVTEKSILDKVGDSRYTREILRRLLAQGIVGRAGKGGSNDPFLYTVVKSMLNADGKCAVTPNLIDPGLEVRLKRIEGKIVNLLSKETSYTTEKSIRMQVGDNTGTGKALRRLVMSGRVIREGKGGVGDPFRYKFNTDPDPQPLAPPPAPVVAKVEEMQFSTEPADEEPAMLANPVQSDSALIVPFAAGEEHKKRGAMVRREMEEKSDIIKPRVAVESFSPKWARKYEKKMHHLDGQENSLNESMNSSGHLNDSMNEKIATNWYLGAPESAGDNSLGDLGDSLGMNAVLDNDDATSVHSSTGSDDLSGPSEIGDSDRSNSPPPHSACSLTSSRGRSANDECAKGIEGPQDSDKLLGALFSTEDLADAFLV